MKKITSLLLTLCLVFAVFSFASCAETPKSAYEVVNEAITNTQSLDSFSGVMTMDMTMNMMGLTLEIPMVMDMSIDNTNPDAPVASVKMSAEMFGQSVDMDMYLDSEWIYMTSMGESYKMNINGAGAEYNYTETADDMLQMLPEELFEGKKMTDNGDGTQSISLEIPSEMFAEIFDEAIKSAGSTAGSAEGLDDIDIADTSVSITVTDGYVKNYDMAFTMTMVIEGIEATVAADMSLEYNSIGEKVTVTPPAGYESFPELTAE